jgi:hypothetical protein
MRAGGGTIDVALGENRRQRVTVDDPATDAIRLWSVVARPSALRILETPLEDAWRRNRLSEFVGFTMDGRGRMIGETWVPLIGITPDEWGFLVKNLARACDRFEYLVSGKDDE